MLRRRWFLLSLLVVACASDPNHAGGKGGAGGKGAGGMNSGASGSGGSAGTNAGTAGAAGTGGSSGTGGSAIAGTGGGAGAGGSSSVTDGGSDAPTDGSAPVCGNGIVESGEQCDYVNGRICVDCQYSACGACLARNGATEDVCATLTGADRLACQTLWTCLSEGAFVCLDNYIMPTPTCDDGDCYDNGGGKCVSEFNALAHSSDPTEVERQLHDPSTTLGALRLRATHAACHTNAHHDCGYNVSNIVPCNFDPGPVINEIDYQQPGGDSQEFVEIYNNSWATVDFTGMQLVFYSSTDGQTLDSLYLTVALSGIVPIGGYLVVGDPSLQVGPGVQKIDFSLPSDNIRNGPGGICLKHPPTGVDMLVWGLPAGFTVPLGTGYSCGFTGSGEPAGLTGDDDQAPRSLCRLPNGHNSTSEGQYSLAPTTLVDWTKPCSKPTPGAANVP